FGRPGDYGTEHLYNKIIVVPKPQSCNSFYVFYAMIYNESANGLFFKPKVYLKEIEYIDEETINISSPILLSVSDILSESINGVCDDANGLCMTITEYNSDYQDYLFVLEWINAIKIFRITENINSISGSSFTFQVDDYIPYSVNYYPNETSSDIYNNGCNGTHDSHTGATRASNVLIEDNYGDILFIKAGRGYVFGRDGAYPAIAYYKFPRDFSLLNNNMIENKFLIYDRAYTHNGIGTQKFRNICGMELSPNKNYLYVTFTEMDSLYYFDISSFMSGLSEFPQTYSKLDIGGNYRYSELKLLGDGKIYAVEHISSGNSTDGYGKLATINSPDNPGTTTISRNLYSEYQLKRVNLIRLEAADLSTQWRRRYTFSHTYDSDYETMYPPAYHNIQDWSSIAATWSPGKSNNPFGSASGDVYINGNLIVPSGKNITINNMTLRFSEGKKLVITKGASLTLNNCTITNNSYCDASALWGGILVTGTEGVVQNSSTHGKVTIAANTVIENAERGVESQDGGIVITSGTMFRNNVYGIYFDSYRNSHSLSSVKNTDFITDKIFDNSANYPLAHIYLKEVSGVIIYRNRFKNTVSYNPGVIYYVEYRGMGIRSLNSSFAARGLLGKDQTIGDGNTYEGLYYGIYSTGDGSSVVDIRFSTFTDNFRGIYLSGTNGSIMAFNTITTTIANPAIKSMGIPVDGSPLYDTKYGAYFSACTNYKIESNTMNRGTAGLYVNNTGASGNEVYKNNFGDNTYTLTAGTIVIGKNSNFIQNDPVNNGNLGLQVRCNKYNKNNNAITVLNGNMRRNQGDAGGAADKLAGNQFHKAPYDNTREFKVQYYPGYSGFNLGIYNYNQHDDSNAPANDLYMRELTDGKYTASRITTITVRGATFVETTSCKTTFPTGLVIADPPIGGIIKSSIENITGLGSDLEDLESDYSVIVDKGDEMLMTTTAEAMNTQNYVESYRTLSNSGYLSDDVYSAVIDNTTAPGAAKAAVLINNSPLPENSVSELETSGMDSDLKNLVMEYQDGINAREKLEYQIWDIKQEISLAEADMVRKVVGGETGERQELIAYFSGKADKTYNTYLDIYNLQVNMQDYISAGSTLQQLSTYSATLPPELSVEVDNYCSVNNIYLNSLNDGLIDTSLLVLHKEELLEAALSGSWLYSAQAKTLYSYLTDTIFPEYTPLPEDITEPRKLEIKQDIPDMFRPVLKVYPNPNKGFLFIEYDFGRNYEPGYDILFEATGKIRTESCNKGNINIYTIEGRLVKTGDLENEKGLKTMDISSLPDAIYILEISDCYGNSSSEKITKQ
ncbi:MAG: hypothetical protein LBQ22_01010, partial [Bacteroidales bacterium]|nr:hypothetical protein [Bacteroidales bacterium]